jgi:polyphenol oxidase
MCMMDVPQPTDGFRWKQASWGEALECEPLARVAPHVFTSRVLDLTAGSNGTRERWDEVAAAIGAGRGVLRVRQVHGTTVAVVRRNARRHAGHAVLGEADAIVSDDPEVGVAAQVADCIPMLLADRRRAVVAAVHAGWRGTARRIVQRVVEELGRTFGSAPHDLIAAVGPSIGPCCYQVGPEVREAFRAAGHEARDLERWFAADTGDRLRLDMWRAIVDQLRTAGIPAAAAHCCGLCTASSPNTFYSYRVDGRGTGRMIGAIRAPGE